MGLDGVGEIVGRIVAEGVALVKSGFTMVRSFNKESVFVSKSGAIGMIASLSD